MTAKRIDATGMEARKQAWRAFMRPDAPPGFLFVVRYHDHDSVPTAPQPWPEKAAERIEYKWRAYQRGLERAAVVHDDAVPYLSMVTGTEIFAEAFGCQVHRPTDNMPFALPLIRSAGEVAALKVPELSTSSLAYLFDMADELRRRGGPDAALCMVDIQSPMDIAALIWEKASFYIGLVETPEAVKELAGKVAQLLTTFLDEWFRRYGVEYVAHYPDYYMPRGVTLSEDEVGVVNGEMFDTFFGPELAALSARYGGLGMHCCADARHQWERFRALPGLRLLNLVKPPTRGEAYIRDAYAYFAGTCAQMHMGWTPPGSASGWLQHLPTESRVVLELHAGSESEAVRLADTMQAVRASRATASRPASPPRP
jgi:hypothetical protein